MAGVWVWGQVTDLLSQTGVYKLGPQSLADLMLRVHEVHSANRCRGDRDDLS